MAAALIVVAAAACGRPVRPVPLAQGVAPWPTLLGTVERDGYADEAPPSSVEVAWRARVGRGLVSPLVVAGPALLAASSNRMVAALSTETGEHYWEKRLDGPVTGGIVEANGRLFVAEERQRGEAHALALRDGDREWKQRIGSSPFPALLRGDTVFVATEGGNLLAFDARDGDRIWRARLGRAAAATPIPFEGRLAVLTQGDTLVLLDRATGEVQASAPLPATPSAAPVLRGDTLIVPLHTAELVGIALPGLETAWRVSTGAPVLAPPVAAPDGSVYLLNRDAEVWRVPPGAAKPERLAELGGAARGSLTLARGHLLVGRLDGMLFLLRLDGSVVWQKDLEDSIAAPVAVRDGAVYVPLVRGHIVKLRQEG